MPAAPRDDGGLGVLKRRAGHRKRARSPDDRATAQAYRVHCVADGAADEAKGPTFFDVDCRGATRSPARANGALSEFPALPGPRPAAARHKNGFVHVVRHAEALDDATVVSGCRCSCTLTSSACLKVQLALHTHAVCTQVDWPLKHYLPTQHCPFLDDDLLSCWRPLYDANCATGRQPKPRALPNH